MKIILLLIFTALFTSVVSAQMEPVKAEVSSPGKSKVKINKREFPDVPEKVRDYHARGMIRVRAHIGAEGNVTKADMFFFGSNKDLKEYVERTVADWKFEPRVIDGKNVAFKTVIEIPFCYGSFSSWCFD